MVAIVVDVGEGAEASFLYSSKTTSEPIPGHTISSSCSTESSLEIEPS